MPTTKCLEYMDIDNTVRCLREKGHEGRCCPHERSHGHGKTENGHPRRICLDCGERFLIRDALATKILSEQELLEEVRLLAHSDITDYMIDSVSREIKTKPGVNSDATRAISSCKWERFYSARGDLTRETIEIKMHDKRGVLDMAGKHFGLFPSRVGIEDPDKALAKLLGVKKEEMP